jgi:hypothetical protein
MVQFGFRSSDTNFCGPRIFERILAIHVFLWGFKSKQGNEIKK